MLAYEDTGFFTASEQCPTYCPSFGSFEEKCCTEDEIGGPSLSSEENTMRQSIDAVNDAIWLFSVDGISLNLSQEEKRRIEGKFDNGWLSDTIIDATQVVLRQQCP